MTSAPGSPGLVAMVAMIVAAGGGAVISTQSTFASVGARS
jgi:hypothetical protein